MQKTMERKFAIISDSSSDMPESYFKENNIECVSLGFLMDNELYLGDDGKQIDTQEFYAKVRNGAMPTTYQVNVESAKTHIEKYLKAGQDVLVVAFSSGLSGTANSFFAAAKELEAAYPERKVLVSDSLCASMGEGLYLYYAVQKADTGASLQETYDYIESIKQNVVHYFTVNDLFHLKRGGRVSAATAVVGTLLNIKPVLYVSPEGKLVNIGKAVGRKKSIKALLDKMRAVQCLQEGDPIFISHGDCIEDAEYLSSLIKAEYPEHPIFIHYVGPVIGSHSGPGTLALFFRGVERRA
jgi:DegV family protein with EDD domain